jgi:hypothetical protein
VAEIQAHSKPVIESCYENFLVSSYDPDAREYPDDADQIREILIHGNYLSTEDMKFCVSYDLSRIADHHQIEGIENLHQSVRNIYGEEIV